MEKLKLTRPSFYLFSFLFSFLAAALLLAITPAIGSAQLNPFIFAVNAQFPPCDIGCWSPDGGENIASTTPDQVRSSVAFVGDVVEWGHAALNGTSFSVTASTTQGDYLGHNCPEPGGLNGYLVVHENTYSHTFVQAQDCYYRDIYHAPDPNNNPPYPGAQGVVHILPTTGPSPYWLMPMNASTAPSVAQTFVTFYADPGLSSNLSDSSFTLTGVGISRSETVHYNPGTNILTLQGAGGSCGPGDSTTLTDGYLTLDCSNTSVLTSGVFLEVTYSLIPQPPMSGYPYQLSTSAVEMGGATRSKSFGSWTVNRPPSVGNTSPMNSTTPVGTLQTFTIVFSDPDGYQNIAAANFYMSGNGGAINQWVHYLPAPNLFTLMGSPDFCIPGQAKTLSSGSLSFNCATSTVTGSGTNLTVVFKVTPLTGSIMYQFFNNVSDQAGGAATVAGGTWQIP